MSALEQTIESDDKKDLLIVQVGVHGVIVTKIPDWSSLLASFSLLAENIIS